MLPYLKALEKWTGKVKDHSGVRITPWPVFVLGAALLLTSFVFMPGVVSFALSLALFLAPLWLPFLLISGAWTLWIILRRSEFLASQKYVLLEIKLPRSLVKTPLAMEAVISGLHLTGGEGTWYARVIKGSTRAFWSFEIASLEGQLHFYVWGRAGFRRLLEAQLYAQYPEVQIVEAVDYSRIISGSTDEWSIWGCDYTKIGKDPLPIKTYVEYGLDKVQKEPEQVDPLANVLELMGSIGKGEYLWLQFVFRAHKGEKYNKLNKENKAYTWKDEAKELVDEIREQTRQPFKDPATGKDVPGFPNPTKGQTEKIAAIERNISKLNFDVGGRSVYLAKPDSFNPGMIAGMIGLFKQFTSEGWNGIKPAKWMMQFDDYPWEIGANKLKNKFRAALVEVYRRRQFFYEPFSFGLSHDAVMVMSTEEIATIFHIPSHAIETPGLGRIPSATSEAPINLPT